MTNPASFAASMIKPYHGERAASLIGIKPAPAVQLEGETALPLLVPHLEQIGLRHRAGLAGARWMPVFMLVIAWRSGDGVLAYVALKSLRRRSLATA